MQHGLGAILVLGFAIATGAVAHAAPSQPGVDAPELAHLGQFSVGVRTISLVQGAQVDVLAFDAAKGVAPKRDRSAASRSLVSRRSPASRIPGNVFRQFPGRAPCAADAIHDSRHRGARRTNGGGTIPAGDRVAWLQQRGRRDELADRESCLERLCRRRDPPRRPADHRPQQVSRAPASPAPRYRVRRPVAATLAQRGRRRRSVTHGADRVLHGRLRRTDGGRWRTGPREPARANGAGRPLVAVCAWRRLGRFRARRQRQGGRGDFACGWITPGLGCRRASCNHVPAHAHRWRPRRDRRLPERRARFLRHGEEQPTLPVDVPRGRAPHRPRAGA